MDLTAYLTPHFRLSEFASKDGAGFPDSVIDDLTKQAQLLEIIREAAGNKPILINSGYRSPGHNSAVGGATHSQHVEGTAADFNIAGMTPRATTDLITGLIDQGRLPAGGLGVYNNWVHYDHRPNGNARWAGDGGPVPARAKVVNNGFAMQPETSGAAPASFVDAPQGSIPPESPAVKPLYPGALEQGMGVYKSLMEDLGNNAKTFNYADQLKAREAFRQKVMDQYGESQEMGLGDIPGAVIGAPVLALKHLLAPLRRAMGNREQASLDMWGGQGGLETMAAISGDPTIAEKYAETPGAGAWLKSLVTDSQERRANAARAAIARMGLYDKKMAEDSRTFLTEAQTGAAKADMWQKLIGGLNQTEETNQKRYLTDAQIRAQNAEANKNFLLGNEVATNADAWRQGQYAGAEKDRAATRGIEIDNANKPSAHQAWLDNMRANAGLTQARTAGVEAMQGPALDKINAEIAKIGLGGEKIAAETNNLVAQGDVIRNQVESYRLKNLLTQEQIEVMSKTGKLIDEKTAREWIDTQGAALRQVQEAQMSGLQADALQARIAEINSRTEATQALIAARAQRLPGELGKLQSEIDEHNARAAAAANRYGLLTNNIGGVDEYKRALIRYTEARTNKLLGQGPVDPLKERTANRLEAGAENKLIADITQQLADGTITLDGARVRLEQNGIMGLVPVDQTGLGRRIKNAFVGGAPDIRLDAAPKPAAPSATPAPQPTPTAIPKNNVGGHDGLSSGTVSSAQAAAINSGVTNPDYYPNDQAGKELLRKYVRDKTVSEETAAMIVAAKGW